MYKVHQWNVLNTIKVDEGDGRYNVRSDFSLDIANEAWANEGIAIIGLQEICKSSVEQFAASRSIPTTNYKFLDYKGSSYSGSSSTAYDKDIAGCRAASGDNEDDYGLAIISRGTFVDSTLIRNTGAGLMGYGERGIACIKTSYLDRILASCSVHTQFDSNASDPYDVTRIQMAQNESAARSYASSSPAASYLFIPGDYNLSPTNASLAEQPGPIMDAQFHGHNTGLTWPSVSPTKRIDHVYFSKSLKYLTTDTPVCSGPGIATSTSAPIDSRIDNGDHCYIGAVAYETGSQAVAIIPGTPNAGNMLRSNSTVILVGGINLIGLSFITLRRRLNKIAR